MFKNVVFLCLTLCFATTACNAETPRESGAEFASAAFKSEQADYLTLLPEDVNVVFYANLAKMRQTELGQELNGQIHTNIRKERDHDYLDFVEATGLELEKDVYEVWVGTYATDGQREHGGLIATGKFDKKRIHDYIRGEHGRELEEVTYRGHTIFVSRERKDRSEFAFLGEKTAVAGERDWVKSIIDRSEDEGNSVLDNPAMATQIEQVAEATNHLWGVMNLAEASNQWAHDLKRNTSFRGTESIKNIQMLTIQGKLSEKADMLLTGNFTTVEEAELLAETMNGFKAMAKLMMGDDREAIDMLNQIKISTEGELLKISAKVDKKFFDKAKEKRKSFSNSPVKML